MSCIFCRIISGEIPSRTVSATDLAVAFMDAFPLAPGHTLVVPREHRERIQDMTAPEVSDVFGLAARLVSKTDSLAGSTLLAVHNGPGAGQEVPHVHVHLVPRRDGDGAGPIHSMFGGAVRMSDDESEEILKALRA